MMLDRLLEQLAAAHSDGHPECLTCQAYGALRAAIERCAQLEVERDDAKYRAQALTTAAELAASGLTAAVLRATDGNPATELLADLRAPQPATSEPGSVLRLPVRQDIPTHEPTPAGATAEADPQLAPTR